jgi:hypothetical protein
MSLAADKDFNGRWNLLVPNEARGRAWWLEVNGAGSKTLSGRFVGAPAGQMDKIPEIRIEKGELQWFFEKPYRIDPSEPQPKVRRATYSARLVGGKLVGKLIVEGKVLNTFTGAPAPVIRDKEDGRWKLGTPEDLFNGRDLSNWEVTFPGRQLEWSVKDGIVQNASKASDIRTKEKYWNFELHAEYKFEKGSNSGIGLRGRYEIQIQDTFGQAADGHAQGAVYSRIFPAVEASNPPGEWQTLDIRLVGRIVTVKLNGKLLIDKKEIEGPTAMVFDPNEADPGPIAVQGDHGIVQFRKLTLTPLLRQ